MQIVADAVAPWRRQVYEDQVDRTPPRQAIVRIFLLMVRRTSRFNRETAEPMLLEGDCLEPYFRAGDVVLFDRQVKPLDGDVVAVMLWYESRDVGSDRPRYAQRLAAKQLHLVAGRRYLVARDGYLEGDECEILGPVVGWHRPGWWRRPAVRHMHFRMRDRADHPAPDV